MDHGPAMRWRATVRTVIRLVPVTMDLIDAAITGDDALALALGHDVTRGWLTFREALPVTRNALAASPAGSPWGARLFVSGEPPELIGWGGFKGGPEGGAVEIGTRSPKAGVGEDWPPQRHGPWSPRHLPTRRS
jgi:hypothetical protein